MTGCISRAELARRAGVSKPAVTKACKGPLKDAVSSEGVNPSHPVIVAYLEKHAAAGTQPAPMVPEELQNLSLREIIARHESIDGYRRYVDTLRAIADYQAKDLRARAQRGELIERDLVRSHVLPLIEVAYSRLVSDVPTRLAKTIVACVLSGGDSVLTEVEALIRAENSKVLKQAKARALDVTS